MAVLTDHGGCSYRDNVSVYSLRIQDHRECNISIPVEVVHLGRRKTLEPVC